MDDTSESTSNGNIFHEIKKEEFCDVKPLIENGFQNDSLSIDTLINNSQFGEGSSNTQKYTHSNDIDESELAREKRMKRKMMLKEIKKRYLEVHGTTEIDTSRRYGAGQYKPRKKYGCSIEDSPIDYVGNDLTPIRPVIGENSFLSRNFDNDSSSSLNGEDSPQSTLFTPKTLLSKIPKINVMQPATRPMFVVPFLDVSLDPPTVAANIISSDPSISRLGAAMKNGCVSISESVRIMSYPIHMITNKAPFTVLWNDDTVIKRVTFTEVEMVDGIRRIKVEFEPIESQSVSRNKPIIVQPSCSFVRVNMKMTNSLFKSTRGNISKRNLQDEKMLTQHEIYEFEEAMQTGCVFGADGKNQVSKYPFDDLHRNSIIFDWYHKRIIKHVAVKLEKSIGHIYMMYLMYTNSTINDSNYKESDNDPFAIYSAYPQIFDLVKSIADYQFSPIFNMNTGNERMIYIWKHFERIYTVTIKNVSELSEMQRILVSFKAISAKEISNFIQGLDFTGFIGTNGNILNYFEEESPIEHNLLEVVKKEECISMQEIMEEEEKSDSNSDSDYEDELRGYNKKLKKKKRKGRNSVEMKNNLKFIESTPIDMPNSVYNAPFCAQTNPTILRRIRTTYEDGNNKKNLVSDHNKTILDSRKLSKIGESNQKIVSSGMCMSDYLKLVAKIKMAEKQREKITNGWEERIWKQFEEDDELDPPNTPSNFNV